jgi:hypothetical protein
MTRQYPVLRNYQGAWPIHEMIKQCLKSQTVRFKKDMHDEAHETREPDQQAIKEYMNAHQQPENKKQRAYDDEDSQEQAEQEKEDSNQEEDTEEEEVVETLATQGAGDDEYQDQDNDVAPNIKAATMRSERRGTLHKISKSRAKVTCSILLTHILMAIHLEQKRATKVNLTTATPSLVQAANQHIKVCYPSALLFHTLTQ